MTLTPRSETTGRAVFITDVVHRRIPYLKNLVGQVAPQALPDTYIIRKFLFRSDWMLSARGGLLCGELLHCYKASADPKL